MKKPLLAKLNATWCIDMPKFTHLLFDFDGTLVDSMPGVVSGIRYVQETLGYPTETKASYKRYIGPPLLDSFKWFCGDDKEAVLRAVELYRAYYVEKGQYESCVFPGMLECLASLRGAGMHLYVATSKHLHFALMALKYHGLIDYFDGIYGADDTRLFTKANVIFEVLEKEHIAKENALMIGDRFYDMEGAEACGIAAMGALYGYGEKEEFSYATFVASSPSDIPLLLLEK
ncbi:MAG: HAD hydrolase-like protein [Clostridia bacterium]|nr:HAD hydrolase-like protein [Clostridia bacterium]